jgi:hypothetical protein
LKDEFEPYVSTHFEPIYSDLAKEPLVIGGVRVTRSAYGMGACVMKRIVKPQSIR